MDFPEIVSGNIFNIGQLFLNLKFAHFDNNWIFAPILCVFVIIEFLIIQSYQKSTVKKFVNFFPSDRFGCWLIIILPMVLYYFNNYSDLLTILIGGLGGLILHCFLNGAFFAAYFSLVIWTYLIYSIYKLSILSTILYPIILTTVLSQSLSSFFSGSFLLGESILVSQIISLFMFKSIFCAIFALYYLSIVRLTPENDFAVYISMIITSFFIFISIFSCKYFNKNIVNDISHLVFTIVTVKSLVLIVFWLFLLFFCLIIVYIIYNLDKECLEDDVTQPLKFALHSRKIFHFAASIVFLTGIVYDAIDLINICSVLLFIVMLMLEHIRRKKIGTVGKTMYDVLHPLFDKRDQGAIILSPLGLLCGLSLPFWISSLYEAEWSDQDRFWLCSGIITVGIGDSFAALVGRRFGKHFWNYKLRERTLEGSFACYISQLVACIFLFAWFNIPLSDICFQRAFLAAVTTTFIEAHTCQLDNIVLPLVFYSFQ